MRFETHLLIFLLTFFIECMNNFFNFFRGCGELKKRASHYNHNTPSSNRFKVTDKYGLDSNVTNF